jgi:secreted PhoX family phosphatase
MSPDEEITNRSNNRPFEAVLKARLERRAALAGGIALAASAFFTSPAAALRSQGQGRGQGNRPLVGFEPLPLDGGPIPIVSPDYEYSVLIPWGTPLNDSAPPFSWPQTSSAAQENQVGIGHDGMWFFPTGGRQSENNTGVLCINHEFGRTSHVLGKAAPENLEEVRIMQAAHGISMISIRRTSDGTWEVDHGGSSRRVTVNTPVEFSGPVAGSDLIVTPAGDAPTGTLNNCSNGYTPWGTYLTCEENFNGYYGATGEWEPTEAQARYGFTPVGFGYGWHNFDPRFDLSNPDYVNADNRYGWVVEVDPYNQEKMPVKRTALGRFKHEGAALTVGRGERAVVYMGDDQRFDYIYKFVSEANYNSMIARNQSPLDHGTLYAARFNEDGSGDWLELSIDNPALSGAFADQAEVLTYARMAADIVGATPMDRPEWTSVAPTGDVFCTLTNNSRRTQPDAANPEAPNLNGHIMRWRDSDRHVGTTFEWDIFLLASSTHGGEDAFGSPDGIWADPDGRLFIQTDGAEPEGANDQMLVADFETGELRRIFTGVVGAEITGIAVTPDRRTMFINLQHPGNGDAAATGFPDYGGAVPRDATVALTRKDGGIIGS